MLTALIAVAGTLLGAIITHWFQRSAAERAAQHAVLERLRQDRLLAYSAFATAAMDYRRQQVDRWHSVRRDPSSEAIRAIRLEDDPDTHKEAIARASESIDVFVRRAALGVQALPAPRRARAIGPSAADATPS
ncbi:hypothetical protein [Nocardia higoensis]|uniref:hypothetical protein n=1 Tax=Nocardia higoensis TaxID=228599 RepID=UPI0002D776DD|nr:hypothetical protein [Nocardia higoensis]